MSESAVWASAQSVNFAFDEPGEFEDSSGQHNDQLALIFATGDLPLVIEGSTPEIRAMLHRALATLNTYSRTMRYATTSACASDPRLLVHALRTPTADTWPTTPSACGRVTHWTPGASAWASRSDLPYAARTCFACLVELGEAAEDDDAS